MTPTGSPKDFKVKTCLHSVSYAGFWPGQAKLSVDEFLNKAKQLEFDGVMLVSKPPHVSLLDYDAAARKALRQKIEKLGLEVVYHESRMGGDMNPEKPLRIDWWDGVGVYFLRKPNKAK